MSPVNVESHYEGNFVIAVVLPKIRLHSCRLAGADAVAAVK
jgi:hypothetical protein